MSYSRESYNFIRKTVAVLAAISLGLASTLSDATATESGKIIIKLPKTWVVIDKGEIGSKTPTAVTINEPEVLKFKWGTEWKEADEGAWRLVQLGPRAKQETTLVTGLLAGSAGAFSLDLKPHLPTPPAVALTYHLQVVARKKGSIDKTTATSPGQGGAKIPPKELGFWSAPVVITYVKSTAPTTTFEFPEVYRKATFYLDKFVVVEDQSGDGREEFHIGGFIQELFQTGDQGGKFDKPGRQIEIGPYYQEMNPPKSIGFTVGVYDPAPKHWNFNLSNKKDEWPRRFLVGFSVLEEDAGSGLGAWNKSLKTVKIEIKKGQVLKMTQKQIENFLKGKLVEGSGWVVAAAELIAGAAAPAGAIAGPVVLVAGAVVLIGVAVGAIIADMDDDDYGTNGALLTLPSNRVDDIRTLPGNLVGKGQYEKYVTSQQKLTFAGPALAGAAVACCDGKVEIRFHWEFSQREPE